MNDRLFSLISLVISYILDLSREPIRPEVKTRLITLVGIFKELINDVQTSQKLTFMDTCESGEIDDGVENTYYALAGSLGFSARTTRANRVFGREFKNKVNRPYLYDLDRYVYDELARRSGAIVFSSSRGGEFSYESDEIENGFFTDAILQFLAGGKYAVSAEKYTNTDELRDYVSKAVGTMIGRLQRPTVDRDNIYIAINLGRH